LATAAAGGAAGAAEPPPNSDPVDNPDEPEHPPAASAQDSANIIRPDMSEPRIPLRQTAIAADPAPPSIAPRNCGGDKADVLTQQFPD
jgi:hypothetical protein